MSGFSSVSGGYIASLGDIHRLQLQYHYCSSDNTDCGIALAWATIAVPACCRIWKRVRLAVSMAKSASMMRPREAAWFSAATCRLFTTDWKRFCTAP